MKVRLTEEKLKSLIRQSIKETYDSFGQNIDHNLFDLKFINTTQRYKNFVQKVYDKLNPNEDDVIDDPNDAKRAEYLYDLLELLDKIIYAHGVDI